MAGTWVALAFMPVQRRNSRAYLQTVLGRPPALREIWRHFYGFTGFLMQLLRTGRGMTVRGVLAPINAVEFDTLLNSDRPALFGTFHFGSSDLLGYLLAARGRRVSMVRMRVGNSEETRRLGERFAGKISFLWINDAAQLIFGLKAALEAGESLALKCDRLEFTAKAEAFNFLGAARLFPFTIYHVGILFERPVAFCVALPGKTNEELQVFASTVFNPDPAAGREANLRAARIHFQEVLSLLETLVRQHPYQWFNFLPLNPVVPPAGR